MTWTIEAEPVPGWVKEATGYTLRIIQSRTRLRCLEDHKTIRITNNSYQHRPVWAQETTGTNPWVQE